MYVDFKVTTWERVELPDNLTEKEKTHIINGIKIEKITSSNNLIDTLEDMKKSGEYSVIVEAEEQMTVKENNGCATIEFFEEKGTIIPIVTNIQRCTQVQPSQTNINLKIRTNENTNKFSKGHKGQVGKKDV